MIQKFTISLTLLLISLIWLAQSFISVHAAGKSTPADYEVVLAPPAAALPDGGDSVTPMLVSQQAVTVTSASILFLPLVFRKFCTNAFSYNETLRYNLSKINAASAWENCSQGQGIKVAVIDTGVDLDHSDLQANIVSGKSFVSGVSSPDDDYGHGTHVAGTVAAVNNNGGVIGVAPKASIMPVKVLNSSGSGSTFDVADGIEWAADNGAKVINLSLASTGNSSTLKAAVDYAYNKGILLVAAGGNCGDSNYGDTCDYQDQPVYPGAYSNVIAVASTTSSDGQSSFSNQGSYIDIAAPGSFIYSTYYLGSYTTMSGTSMASPHVAGLAALIWSQDTSLTQKQVWAQIKNTAQDLGTSGWDSQFGYGRINAAAAMGTTQIAAATTEAESTPAATATEVPYVPGEILLKLQTGVSVNRVLDQDHLETAEVKVADTIDQLDVQKLEVPAGQEQSVLAQLRSSSGVEYAELNYIVIVQ
ncbi:MAG: peptidase S8 [Anaerolineales bacterium]|nr:peptidase S8 [Anaerolineales bacterium]